MSFLKYPNFVNILAGSGYEGYSDGIGSAAKFWHPTRLLLESSKSSLFVSDSNNNCIRIINTKDASVSTLTGFCGADGGRVDGSLSEAKFNDPVGLIIISDEMIVADRLNYVLRKIFLKNGTVTTFSGSGSQGYLDGNAHDAKFGFPCGIDIDRREGFEGSVLVSEGYYSRIRLVFPNGSVSTLAGTDQSGFKNGPALEAQFHWITDVRSNSAGTIYIADNGNAALRELKNGNVTTFAGIRNGFFDGPLSKALFEEIHGFTFDKNESFIITDPGNNLIRQIFNGSVRTLAGTWSADAKEEGSALKSKFNYPVDVALDLESETLYVADWYSHSIKVICSAPCYNGGFYDCIKRKCTCPDKFLDPFCLSTSIGTGKTSSIDTLSFTSLGPKDTTMVKEVIIVAVAGVTFIVVSIIAFCIFRFRNARKPAKSISSSPESNIIATPSSNSNRKDFKHLETKSSFETSAKPAKSFSSSPESYIVSTPTSNKTKSFETSAAIDPKSIETLSTITSSMQGVISIPGHRQLNIDNDLNLSNESKIGEGGTSAIYKCTFAKASLLARFGFNELAIKILKVASVNTLSLLKFEIAIMSSIPPHQNIVHFVGYSEDPYAIVLKYYPMSLRDIIYTSNFQNNIDLTNKIAFEIASGMEHIHKHDIIHLDLKPSNVLLDLKPDRTFKCIICDFGFANFIKESNKQYVAGIPTKNPLGLTPKYAAPEMIEQFFSEFSRLELAIHKKIDVYAYSICLFELIASEPAWNKVSFEDIKRFVLAGERPTASKVIKNDFLQDIMKRCWKQSPVDRPDFHELVKANTDASYTMDHYKSNPNCAGTTESLDLVIDLNIV